MNAKLAFSEHRRSSEHGQALVLIVLAMVALLGFTALAIDGGMLYSDRRAAQNAADAAAMTGALQKANGQPDGVVMTAAYNMLAANGYDAGQTQIQITGPHTDITGSYYLVQVSLTSSVNTAFTHFIYDGPVQNTVAAAGRAALSAPPLAGLAIVTLGDDCSSNPSLSVSGGGNSGGINAFNGGVNGEENIAPRPIVTGANGGVPIGDPLPGLAAPTCATAGSLSGTVFNPGRFTSKIKLSGKNTYTFTPGIYCFEADLEVSGQASLQADGGVLFFFKNAGMDFSGQGNLTLVAPSSGDYRGVAIFSDRNHANVLNISGNGLYDIQGLVYGPRTHFLAQGGGSTPEEALVKGQVIVKRVTGNGNGSFSVWYRDDLILLLSPMLSLER